MPIYIYYRFLATPKHGTLTLFKARASLSYMATIADLVGFMWPSAPSSSMKEVCMSYSQTISSLLLKCEETQRRTLSIGSICSNGCPFMFRGVTAT